LVSIVGFGAIGFADDYIKIVKRRSLGLTGKMKLALQFSLSFGIGLTLVWLSAAGQYKTNLIFPFFKHFTPSLVLEGFLSSPIFTWLRSSHFCFSFRW
jgi:phospho-N-acetylmuramoyl-pentapeptide-transferase